MQKNKECMLFAVPASMHQKQFSRQGSHLIYFEILDLACEDREFLLRRVYSGGFIFQQAEKSFRWFVNLVRKSLDKFPDASVDRFRMKVVI